MNNVKKNDFALKVNRMIENLFMFYYQIITFLLINGFSETAHDRFDQNPPVYCHDKVNLWGYFQKKQ